jgi:hypothetical protein
MDGVPSLSWLVQYGFPEMKRHLARRIFLNGQNKNAELSSLDLQLVRYYHHPGLHQFQRKIRTQKAADVLLRVFGDDSATAVTRLVWRWKTGALSDVDGHQLLYMFASSLYQKPSPPVRKTAAPGIVPYRIPLSATAKQRLLNMKLCGAMKCKWQCTLSMSKVCPHDKYQGKKKRMGTPGACLAKYIHAHEDVMC